MVPGLLLQAAQTNPPPKGRLTSITQGEGAESRSYSISYDAQNNLRGITDPLLRNIGLAYDEAGRVTKETLPDTSSVAYGYDSNGNVTSITPPDKPTHGFDYTPQDLVKDYLPPAIGPANVNTAYTYDLDRNLIEEDRPAGSGMPAMDITENTAFTYDGSLLTSTTWSGGGNGTVGFEYDNDFNVTSESVNGNAIGFAYDDDGLLTGAGSLSISRDPGNGLITGTTLGNLSDTWTYNGFGEPTTFSASYNGSPRISVQYTRDSLGRIEQKTETIAGVTNTFAYSYDQSGRLTDVKKDDVVVSHYEYDSNGNRLSYTGGAITINGTYDDQDRLVAYGSHSYAYTGNGELLSKTGPEGTTSYNYDNFGNLISVVKADGTRISYIVDGQHRRVGKAINGTLEQGFLYEDQLRPVVELDGSGNIVSRFVYGPKTNVPEYMVKDGEKYKIVTDQLGSPRLVVDVATGQVVQQLDYDEFGNVTKDTNPGFQPFGFAGGVYDRDTALVRFGARDYDPLIGKWTAKDPIGFVGGDTDLFGYVDSVGKPLSLQTNLYQYASNNPVNSIDPYGLFDTGMFITGVLSTAEGIQTIAIGGTAIVFTGIATENPLLTAVVAGEMLPVFWAGWAKTTHGWEVIQDALKEPRKPINNKCH